MSYLETIIVDIHYKVNGSTRESFSLVFSITTTSTSTQDRLLSWFRQHSTTKDVKLEKLSSLFEDYHHSESNQKLEKIGSSSTLNYPFLILNYSLISNQTLYVLFGPLQEHFWGIPIYKFFIYKTQIFYNLISIGHKYYTRIKVVNQSSFKNEITNLMTAEYFLQF